MVFNGKFIRRKKLLNIQGFFISNWVDDITIHSDREYTREDTFGVKDSKFSLECTDDWETTAKSDWDRC